MVAPRIAFLTCLFLLACVTPPRPVETARVVLSDDFQLEPLVPGVFRHVSWQTLPKWGRIASNGLVIDARDGLVVVDTPWTPAQAALLVAWARKPIRHVVITHAHDDRYGGHAELRAAGATLHALPLTIDRATALGITLDAMPLATDATLELAGEPVAVLFPGAAHAPDNVVVSLPARGVLAGGCMVRSMADTSPGNLADADLVAWPQSIRRVIERFPGVTTVVPGHGAPGGFELLTHTRDLVDAAPKGVSDGH